MEIDRNKIIREYHELEKRLEEISKLQSVSLSTLMEEVDFQPEDIIDSIQPILERQVELLYIMKAWELNKYRNIILLPLSNFKQS